MWCMCGCVKLHRIYSEWLKYRFYSYYDIMSTLSSSVISRMMWHGLPAASVCGGRPLVKHCAQTAVRTYENIIADGYIGFVKDGKIEIAYEVLTDVYVCSEVTVKRAVYCKVLADIPHDVSYDLIAFFTV